MPVSGCLRCQCVACQGINLMVYRQGWTCPPETSCSCSSLTFLRVERVGGLAYAYFTHLLAISVITYTMSRDVPYSYEAIQPHQIRLCRFLKDADSLSATLEKFPADGPYPQYNALSYTWGLNTENPSTSRAVQFGEKRLPVLDSLQSFFQALRSRGTLLDGTWWWIDSICIDQKCIRERSEQVAWMKQIYQNAHQVVVWLGEQSDDSDCALNFILFLDDWNRETYTAEYALMIERKENMRKILQKDQYQTHWTALRNFFLRRWWGRVWTTQEFVIPSSAAFWCGPRQISGEAIFAALTVVNRCDTTGFKDTIAFHHAWNLRRAWLLYKSMQHKPRENYTLSLLALATYFCNNEATDDRDRLYGLTGLCTENHALDITYSQSVDEVYLRFAKSFITQHKSLDIVIFASLFNAAPGSSLPSWVPDWRSRRQPLVIPLMASQSSSEFVGNLRPPRLIEDGNKNSARYSASGFRTAVCKFEGLALLAQGCIIDEIDGLAGSRNFEFVQSSQEHSQCSDAACLPKDHLMSVCRSLVLDREDRYLQRSMSTEKEKYYHDFIQLCLLTISEPQQTPVQREFQEWFNSTRLLQIHGKSLEEIIRDIQNDGSNAFAHSTPNQDEYIHDSFYGRFFDIIERMSLRLMTSRDGRIGMAPQNAMKGDLVCILWGCNVPVLLRRSEHEDQFIVVGECFLDGCMEGEALEQGEFLERTFRMI